MTNKKVLSTMLQIVSQLKEDKNNVERKYEKLLKEIGSLPSIVQNHTSEIKSIKSSISSTNQDIQKLMSMIQQYNTSFTEMENRIFDMNKEVMKYSSAIINAENSSQSLKKLATSLLYEIKNLESKFNRSISIIENKLALLEAKTNMNPVESLKTDLKGLYNSVKEIKDIVKMNVKNLEERISRLSNRFESYDLELELMEAMNAIYRTADSVKILSSLEHMESIIQKMKAMNMWNEERNEYFMGFLEDLADAWESYGNHDISDMFRSKIKGMSLSNLTTKK